MEQAHQNGRSAQPAETARPVGSGPGIEAALIHLARLSGVSETPLREIWLEVAALAAQTLDVERVGAWILIDDGRALRCRYLFQRSTGEMFQGAVLRAKDFPHYFKALDERRTVSIDADSGMEHELSPSYLEPLGIGALLDAPIYRHGRIVGVLCLEHVGERRTWTDAESTFAITAADTLSRVFGEREQQNVQATLESYEEHLMELSRMEAVGRMAAGIAHDFRGVIGVALGFAELIRRVPELPTQADNYAQRVVESLERGRQMTERIVRYGKDDPGSPVVLDVGAAVTHASQMFKVLLGRNVRLKLAIDPHASRIFIDPAQFERALLNLVLNSRDAMPDGGELLVDVRDAPLDEEDEHGATCVGISVGDTGCGMDESARAEAFKPFYTTKGERGTGLGLMIVDQIVARAGGRVSIDSEPGRGTTVTMLLPRIAGAA